MSENFFNISMAFGWLGSFFCPNIPELPKPPRMSDFFGNPELDKLRNQAVELGYAEYFCEHGKLYWRWKEPKK